MFQLIRRNRSLALLPLWLVLAAMLAGCAVGPNYHRPAVNVPTAYRQPPDDTATAQPAAKDQSQPAVTNVSGSAATTSLSDEKWWEVFEDKELQGLIRTALKNNYDVRIAAARVLEAQAQLGITRADQLPSVSVGGNITGEQSAASGPIPSFQTSFGQANAVGTWNLDFWGKYRRATEAVRRGGFTLCLYRNVHADGHRQEERDHDCRLRRAKSAARHT